MKNKIIMNKICIIFIGININIKLKYFSKIEGKLLDEIPHKSENRNNIFWLMR